MGLKKMKAARPNASSWDKINARESKDTLANREVHEGQQLDRAERKELRGKRAPKVVGILVAVLVTATIWFLWSIVTFAAASFGSLSLGDSSTGEYIDEGSKFIDGSVQDCYYPVDAEGDTDKSTCYEKPDDVPVPQWYEDAQAEDETSEASTPQSTFGQALGSITFMKFWISVGSGALVGLIIGSTMARRVDVENTSRDMSDINPYTNDQHIALPEELQRKFDVFPDAGAHADVEVSSVISHNMFQRKGLKKVDVVQRAEENQYDGDGEPIYYRGEALTDDAGDDITKSVPIIDEKFGEELFDASGLPEEKRLRKHYDTTVIPYNPDGKDRDKAKYKTVADLINNTWEFPDYEVQVPAGAYIVDTAPVNTMVLAITRAGKGQTYIEPLLDMWSREKNPSNMVINDPKGELLLRNYIPFVKRGFEPIQFNLINPEATDIYNPLGMAAEAAREGDVTKMAMYVENIAEVFFPVDGGEDPVWPTSANNAFKRAVYLLIDVYLEAEKELREHAAATGMQPETLEARLDELWGQVTLYNTYQLFVQLTATKVKNPEAEVDKARKNGDFDDDQEAFEMAREEAESKSFLWEGKGEQDKLTLICNATAALPRNTMRTRVDNAHKSLASMAGAEKMLASVYGISITALSFFTDPTISRLTSGRPSQNVDLGGLSFPRRMGVRFAQPFLKRDHLIGLRAVWSAYGDPMFTENLGKDFDHSDVVTREGWARYYFKGKFPSDKAWIKLELVNPQTQMLVRTFYFEFKKSYQLSLNGRHFVTEPVTDEKIVKNGVLRELRPIVDEAATEVAQTAAQNEYDAALTAWRDGGEKGRKPALVPVDPIIGSYGEKSLTYPQQKLDLTADGEPEKIMAEVRAVVQSSVRYSEKPKAVFLVTPPHLMQYAKLILILIKQLVDLNFDKSYMTKSNQKPLYRTRFLLDELGNLQSEGHGIANFETMLSIGLGQEQQFTLILQTLQQLRSVYGENVDKIVQGNVSNIIFLKSTDDQMIETLEKMSGTTHRGVIDSAQFSVNKKKAMGKVEDVVNYTKSLKEEPLIKANDMAFIAERNSMVFRAGDAPVWNRNATILPMAHALLGHSTGRKPVHVGQGDYELQTVPTLSTAKDFDVERNLPDFEAMLETRMHQAVHTSAAKEEYKKAHGYSEIDISRLNADLYADEVMEIVRMFVKINDGNDPHDPGLDAEALMSQTMMIDEAAVVPNDDVINEVTTRGAAKAQREKKVFAEGTVSPDMLVSASGVAKTGALDVEIGEAYKRCLAEFGQDSAHFRVGADDELRSADGQTLYITLSRSDAYAQAAASLNAATEDESSRVYSEEQVSSEDLASLGGATVHAAFYQYLASLGTWEPLADGAFERAMAIEMRRSE